MPVSSKNLAVYIHWPFCKSKCPYCDFNSHVSEEIDHPAWKQAYLDEIKYYAKKLGNRNVTSVFFGGGTPSLMQPSTVDAILNSISCYWDLAKDAEITLEANPTSIEIAKLRGMKSSGINRVSIGVQSFDDKNLKFLGREHSAKEAESALKSVSEMFDNFSFDLIYALPDQDVAGLKQEMKKVFSFARDHLSMYQLTIEKGTEFFSQYNKGQFYLPKDELAVEMYELVAEQAAKKKFINYEVSNYAKKGFESQHNLAYWHYDDYVGIGPGAHGRLSNDFGKDSITNIYHPGRWLSSMQQKGVAIQKKDPIEGTAYLEEFVLMGMRLQEGISRESFKTRIGMEIESSLNTDKLVRNGLIELDRKGIRATGEGRLVLNQLIEELLSE